MNEERLNDLIGKFLQDLGGAFSIPLVQIGNSLGLYKALQEAGPISSVDLAHKTGLAERYLREWLSAQAASDYITYDADKMLFSLSDEQVAILADPDSPTNMVAAFECAASNVSNMPAISGAFHTGEGVRWGDQPGCLFCAVAKFFRPGYQHHLTQEWLPALDGVVDKLNSGIDVADIGCGHGHSTVIMAEAFPNSRFTGYDFHDGSIASAREHADKHGVKNVEFKTALAKEYPGQFDLVCFFDCLHDMGDPVGAMKHVRQSLKPDGACMIVEPMAADNLEGNLNPIGRLFFSASTMVCVPTSLAQEVGAALGAQAGEARLRDVATEAGFGQFHRATETPFNMILEARV